MKDKMILSFYIDTRGIDNSDMGAYLDSVRQAMSSQIEGQGSDDIIVFFIPIEGESRVECINPVLVTEEEAISRFNNAMNKLQELNFKLEEKLVNKKEDEKTEK